VRVSADRARGRLIRAQDDNQALRRLRCHKLLDGDTTASYGQKECVILTPAASCPQLGTLLKTVRSTQTRIVHKSVGRRKHCAVTIYFMTLCLKTM